MALSRIDHSITYPVVTSINKADEGKDVALYSVELKPNIEATIALGELQYNHIDKGLLYVPVYLVEHGAVKAQIGVYEFLSNTYPNIVDDDGDIDLAGLENPLPILYPSREDDKETSVSTTAGSPQTTPDEVSEPPPNATPALEDTAAKQSDLPERVTSPTTVAGTDKESSKEDTREEEIRQRKEFDPDMATNWVQRYMRNRYYNVVDNEGGGDCLFAVLRDAYETKSMDVTVAQLRTRLSEAATEPVYLNFREQYDMYKKAVPEADKELKRLWTEIHQLKTAEAQERDREVKLELVEKAKILISEWKRTRGEKKHTLVLLKDFKFMQTVTSLDQFKAIVQTCNFWAETWAISTLEELLDIKLIILSSQNYEQGDVGNVLICGGSVAQSFEEKGVFKPKHYIIVDHTGSHYKLVTYKGRGLFTFPQIPHNIKELVVDKCMEKDAGIYNLIPAFRALKASRKSDKDTPVLGDKGSASTTPERGTDDGTVFQFYSKSADSLPGKGAGERIVPSQEIKYSKLAAIPHWRRKLSNFSDHPFELGGTNWATVEHYYHGRKFAKGNPDFSRQFAKDSGSAWAQDPRAAKGAGGRTGRYRGQVLRPSNVTMDADFFSSGEAKKAILDAQRAKYDQNKDAALVLDNTNNAHLNHFQRGMPPIPFHETMQIRQERRTKSPGKK